MNLYIVRGILDNDPKGTTGVGTIFWLKIFVDNELQLFKSWGLLQELNGEVNPNDFITPYHATYKQHLVELAAKEEAEKNAALEARKASIQIDPALDALINEAIASDPKAVQQFKAGKEKALNALVGKVIGQLKKQDQSPDAFAITTTMKKKLEVQV